MPESSSSSSSSSDGGGGGVLVPPPEASARGRRRLDIRMQGAFRIVRIHYVRSLIRRQSSAVVLVIHATDYVLPSLTLF